MGTKVTQSKKVRAGKGKYRNRKYTLRRGPLVVYAEDSGLTKALRNVPGVETSSVDALNLLQLAPGGVFGRVRRAPCRLRKSPGELRRPSLALGGGHGRRVRSMRK